MRKIPQIAEGIYYLGLNDRRLELFENIWPLPGGIAYNSYLITDEKVTLIDTVDSSNIDEYLSRIKLVLEGKKIDYLVINHMEPDHCSGIETIVRNYPDVKIVGNKKTFQFLEAYYNISRNLHEVKEGDELNIGERTLQFYYAPMVHWPEVMVTYEKKQKVLFSADAFGSFGTLDGGITDEEINTDFYWDEFLRYYSNIVGKYGSQVQKVLKKLNSLDIDMIASAHGPVWKSSENIKKVISLYDKWSNYESDEGVVIVYGTMYGNTQIMAEVVARELAERGIKNIKVYDSSKTHPSFIIRDIFKYKGLIIGSCTYNTELHPSVSSLVEKLRNMGVEKRIYASFGSFTWAGQAAKKLDQFGKDMRWDIVHNEIVEQQGALKDENFNEFAGIAESMAQKLSNS